MIRKCFWIAGVKTYDKPKSESDECLKACVKLSALVLSHPDTRSTGNLGHPSGHPGIVRWK